MDRGVKIAIFVASIAALCLGLIWDQVLSHARVVVEETADDPLAAEAMEATIGPPGIGRLNPPEDLAPWERPQVDPEPAMEQPAQPAVPVVNDWLDYVLKAGDSPSKLAHRVFPERGLESTDIKAANPDSKWREGDTIRIPPGKGVKKVASDAVKASSSSAPSGNRPAIEYEVQQDDGWERIANKHKDRGVTWKQIEAANPGVKLVPGIKVKIP
jgi:hypothetical protein